MTLSPGPAQTAARNTPSPGSWIRGLVQRVWGPNKNVIVIPAGTGQSQDSNPRWPPTRALACGQQIYLAPLTKEETREGQQGLIYFLALGGPHSGWVGLESKGHGKGTSALLKPRLV